ncbi:MAG: endonuclease/exonuclease/phosphatase family protein, partial [Acidimicrobiales bacterium]
VVATNILHGNAQAPEALARLVAEWLPEVVIVCEVVREAGAALAGALPDGYQAVHVADPLRVADPDHQSFGGGRFCDVTILARPGLATGPVRFIHGQRRRFPYASIAGMTVAGVHITPPTYRHRRAQWMSDLADVAAWANNIDGPLLIGGDFNAGVHHPPFRALLDDADLARVPVGRRGSWTPHKLFSGSWWPLLIDHVLVRGLTPTAAALTEVLGSDHRAVVADAQRVSGSPGG